MRARGAGVRALVVDVDGVVRTWDPASWEATARERGLSAGSLWRVAFARPGLTRVVTGAMTDAQWRDSTADTLAEVEGVAPADARAVVDTWAASAGQVDDAVVALLQEQRARRPVVLLSNATDRLDADLERLGLAGRFDGVYATWRLGVAKPDPAVYRLVADDLGLPTSACAFVDDSPRHVRGAQEAGMVAHLHTGAAALRVFLEGLDA